MDFLKRYINNTFSKNDLEQVKEALSVRDTPELVHEQMKLQWEKTQEQTDNTDDIDFDSILHKIHHHINITEKLTQTKPRFNWALVGKVAAVLTVPIIIASVWGTLSYKQIAHNNKLFKVEARKGQQSQLTLSDGTEVWLNSNSKIEFTGNYGNENRNIKLVGEGYFKVAKNKQLPFMVTANGLTVTALGTCFNVEACRTDNKVKVTLVEGMVKVQNQSAEKILDPGQQLIADNDNLNIQKVDTEIYTSWHQGILIFKNEVLEDIVHQLEKRYDVTFIFKNEELKSFRYRGRLRLDYSILKSLEILRISTGMHYRIDGRVIILDK